MKQNKRTIIILILAIISASVAGIIGVLYYVANFGLTFASIALTIRNVISCFAFIPTLSVTDVLKWLSAADTLGTFKSEELYSFTMILTHVYAGIILVAPLCTASAMYIFIARIFRQIKWKVMPLFWEKPKDKIMIIGSGDAASDLIDSETKAVENREIYYISAKSKNVDQEINLMRRKIHFCEIDLLNCSDKEFLSFMKGYKSDSMNAIIICEDSDVANFSIYIRLMKLGYGLLSNDCLITCKCEEPSIMNLISSYYDDNKEKCISPKLFSLAKMRVASILEKQPLPVYSDGEDISYLVVGFGMTGQTMVRNMMNLGVANSQSRVVIHVVDQDMDRQKSIFLRAFSSEYFEISEEHCMINSDRSDGILDIQFHKMDLRSREFELFLEENDIQYASICMRNLDYCLDCMQTIQKNIITYNKLQIPIAVSLLSDPEITVYLNQDTKRFKNVIFLGMSTYYNINQILSFSIEERAKKFHQTYQSISVVTLKEYQDMLLRGFEHHSTPWEDVLFYKQESSRMLSRHQIIKEKILADHKRKDKDFSMEQYFGEEGSILQKKDDMYVFEDSMELLVDKLNAVPFLKELGMMEHRRWCYSLAANGWSYGVSKNEITKKSPYLVPWDQLCEEHPEVCIYDYMAYLIQE